MKRLSFFLACASLITLGFLMWLSRPPYLAASPPKHGQTFQSSYQPSQAYDLTAACSSLSKQNGYLLITGLIDMRSIIGERQIFFQTNNDVNRLFLEYDPGQRSVLQFGVAVNQDLTEYRTLGELKKVGPFIFAILISHDGSIEMRGTGAAKMPHKLKVGNVENGNTSATSINCSNFRLNAGNGIEGTDGIVRLSISGGTNYENGLQVINAYKHDYQDHLPSTLYKWPLYGGILLSIGRPKSLKNHFQRSNITSSSCSPTGNQNS